MNALVAHLTGLLALAAAPAKDGGGSPLTMFLPLIIMFAIIYFLVIMPQRKRQRQRMTMLQALKKNQSVITVGGIHGKVLHVREKEVIIKVDDNAKLTLNRSGIAHIKDPETDADSKD